MDTYDEQAFDTLSLDISRETPVVDIKVSDSAAMHLLLYRNAKLVDKYGDMEFPFFSFADEEKAAEYCGHASEWAHLLIEPLQKDALQRLWVQRIKNGPQLGDTEERLRTIAEMFGMSPTLSQVGYTYDDEGLGEKYSEYLRRESEGMDRGDFSELHFTRGR